jgi:hypothetical protein
MERHLKGRGALPVARDDARPGPARGLACADHARLCGCGQSYPPSLPRAQLLGLHAYDIGPQHSPQGKQEDAAGVPVCLLIHLPPLPPDRPA